MKRKSSSDMPGAKDVSDVSLSRSFAFYGRSGSGKTTLVSSFPGPIILLDIKDEGTDSVSDVPGLQVRQIETLEDFEDAYYWLKKNPERYATVAIDTMTQLQQMVVKELIGDKPNKKDKRAGDWGSMSQQDWGTVAGEMKDWIIDFRDLTKLGMQVAFIAQDRVFNADEDSADSQIDPEVGPALSPAIAKTLNAAVSVIANTFIRNKFTKKEVNGKKKTIEKYEYCLRLGPNSVYTTKVRKPKGVVAPSYIVDPTYDDIIEVIKGT